MRDAPLGLVVVWPLGPVDPRERRWATADEAGDLIRRAGCRSPKDEGRLLPAALRRASRLPELYCELCCELGRGRVLATSRPRRALPHHSKGPALTERKRCLAALGGEKAGRRLHSPGVGEGSMQDHTLTRSRGCCGWAQVGAS